MKTSISFVLRDGRISYLFDIVLLTGLGLVGQIAQMIQGFAYL